MLDDDPTPQKFNRNSAASFVPETPLSPPPSSDIAIVKCTKAGLNLYARDLNSDQKFAVVLIIATVLMLAKNSLN